MTAATDDLFKRLTRPFPPEQIGQIPRKARGRGTVMLDYVGHAVVTARLNEVDPTWSWEPLAFDERGLPAMDYHVDGDHRWPVGLWIVLRIPALNIERLGYGDCDPSQPNPVKVLIGDAIRNAAMRAGVALHLWAGGALDPEGDHQADAPVDPHADQRGVIHDRIAALDPEARRALASAWRVWFGNRRVVELEPEELPKALSMVAAAAFGDLEIPVPRDEAGPATGEGDGSGEAPTTEPTASISRDGDDG